MVPPQLVVAVISTTETTLVGVSSAVCFIAIIIRVVAHEVSVAGLPRSEMVSIKNASNVQVLVAGFQVLWHPVTNGLVSAVSTKIEVPFRVGVVPVFHTEVVRQTGFLRRDLEDIVGIPRWSTQLIRHHESIDHTVIELPITWTTGSHRTVGVALPFIQAWGPLVDLHPEAVVIDQDKSRQCSRSGRVAEG